MIWHTFEVELAMRILSYRELESTEELLPLLDHAFRWTFNQRTFDKIAKVDPRLKHSPIGFCAIEDGHIVGHVGVMDIATRTLDGTVETVGGIYGVATIPSRTRKGVSTVLMKRAHEHFREKGYHFSFLGTSRALVAHSFYEKLGYADLFECPSAYKIMKTRAAKAATREKTEKIDFDKVLEIYASRVRDHTGWVVRDKAYFNMLKKWEGFTRKECIVNDEGYVLLKEIKGIWVNGIWIRELVAQRSRTMSKLLELAERRAKEIIYDRAIFDKTLLEVYRSRGYMIHKKSHAVMMGKPLVANASINKTYGDKLYTTGLDLF
jgi:GNAT superfamily N-acetyltransferase